ncbi:hypothetical protein FRB98_003795 [Tulasnella sp. 332]|nr:hypothetical protein FRB98_003795 [Tulasnella sp. 332]
MQYARMLANGTELAATTQNWIAWDGESKDVQCRNQDLGEVNPACTAVPVSMDLDPAITLFVNGSLGKSDDPLGDNSAATVNAMQAVLALALLDVGNIYPNNIIYFDNITTLNATIASGFSIQGAPGSPRVPSTFYTVLSNPNMYTWNATAVDIPPPAVISTEYLCRFSQRKSAGQLFVSVLVATLSMFSSGWAAFILVSAYFEKRRYQQRSRITNTGSEAVDVYDSQTDLEGSGEGEEGEEPGAIPLLEDRNGYAPEPSGPKPEPER